MSRLSNLEYHQELKILEVLKTNIRICFFDLRRTIIYKANGLIYDLKNINPRRGLSSEQKDCSQASPGQKEVILLDSY